MIIFRETHEDANVIHLIMGEESHFQFNMAGHIVVDVSDNIDPNKKNIIYINRCMSEDELQKQIKYFQSKFVSNKDQSEEKPVENNSNKKSRKNKNSTQNEIRCPKCLSFGATIIDGIVQICSSCKKIDEGIKNGDIPPQPSEEQQDDIIKDFLNKKKQNKDG